VTQFIAIKAALISMAVILFFGFAGQIILNHMGISPEAFKIAGGLLLFYTAFNLVMGGHEQTAPDASSTSDNIAVFPMAIPLMAGPGCAAAFILLLESAREQSVSLLYIVLALLAVETLACFALLMATQIKNWLGQGALSILARVTGIFLAALAIIRRVISIRLWSESKPPSRARSFRSMHSRPTIC
jgi:multiple antibiotic resistance protein